MFFKIKRHFHVKNNIRTVHIVTVYKIKKKANSWGWYGVSSYCYERYIQGTVQYVYTFKYRQMFYRCIRYMC